MFQFEFSDGQRRTGRVQAGYELPRVRGISLLNWTEHCVECAEPDCFATCRLYRPRGDGKCRRFNRGLVRQRAAGTIFNYSVEAEFARWAKLETVGIAKCLPLHTVGVLDCWNVYMAVPLARVLALLAGSSKRFHPSKAMTELRNWLCLTLGRLGGIPDYFCIRVTNIGDRLVSLRLLVRQEGKKAFETVFTLNPGPNAFDVPWSVLAPNLKAKQPLTVSLFLLGDVEGVLRFHLLDFVQHQRKGRRRPHVRLSKTASHVKCLILDLDNTLWHGVWAEEAGRLPELRPGVTEVLDALDRRGILLSIVSKNSFETVWPAIRALGLDHVFLYPQISWAPKSKGVETIANSLNVGLDAIGFVDDSAFELAEVKTRFPAVRCYDASELPSLLGKVEFQLSDTAEAKNRRQMYQTEIERKKARSMAESYEDFLRSCQMNLAVLPYQTEYRRRALELVQRTNQFNLSGRKLSESEFDGLLCSGYVDCWILQCCDKFGDYGSVGVCLLNVDQVRATVTDFFLSCRVATKSVERAFLCWLARRYGDAGFRELTLIYRPTGRNQPLLQELEAVEFLKIQRDEGETTFRLDLREPIPTSDFINMSQ